jgi:hypothetical protein
MTREQLDRKDIARRARARERRRRQPEGAPLPRARPASAQAVLDAAERFLARTR